MMNYQNRRWDCYIDCREDGRLEADFLTLNMWGKPVFLYALESAIQSGLFETITVVTENEKVKSHAEMIPEILVKETFEERYTADCVCILSGRASLLSSETIRRAASVFGRGMLYASTKLSQIDYEDAFENPSFLSGEEIYKSNAFVLYEVRNGRLCSDIKESCLLPVNEAVVINNSNDFELALILKKKAMNRVLLESGIRQRIEEKERELTVPISAPSVCFVGHSQMDYWNIDRIAGFQVRNCGIAGISSFAYDRYILQEERLNCTADAFVVMHGTNDIVMDASADEAVSSIQKTIDYIRKRNASAPILFILCLHTNGRMDRSNRKIDRLNAVLAENLQGITDFVHTDLMDDDFGDLKKDYTVDGLHLSEEGYGVFQSVLERKIKQAVQNE